MLAVKVVCALGVLRLAAAGHPERALAGARTGSSVAASGGVLLARAGVLAPASRPAFACDRLHTEPPRGAAGLRRALPELALLRPQRPLGLNYTHAYQYCAAYREWILHTTREEVTRKKTAKPPIFYVDSRHARLFLGVVVLPAGLFVALFLYVVFATGAPARVPYSNIDKIPVLTPMGTF